MGTPGSPGTFWRLNWGRIGQGEGPECRRGRDAKGSDCCWPTPAIHSSGGRGLWALTCADANAPGEGEKLSRVCVSGMGPVLLGLLKELEVSIPRLEQ